MVETNHYNHLNPRIKNGEHGGIFNPFYLVDIAKNALLSLQFFYKYQIVTYNENMTSFFFHILLLLLLLLLFILTANRFLPGFSVYTIRQKETNNTHHTK
jgi:hypothetical protein